MVISSNLKNTNHLLNRIALSYAGIGKLNKETMFDNKHLNPYVKFHQYKTYIRPLLTHGLENICLLDKETRQIQSTETGILLNNLCLPPRIRTSVLLMLIKIQILKFKKYQKRINHSNLLFNNEYTHDFIQ